MYNGINVLKRLTLLNSYVYILYHTADRHDHVIVNDISHEEKQKPDMLVTYIPAINYSTFHSKDYTNTSLIIFRETSV